MREIHESVTKPNLHLPSFAEVIFLVFYFRSFQTVFKENVTINRDPEKRVYVWIRSPVSLSTGMSLNISPSESLSERMFEFEY